MRFLLVGNPNVGKSTFFNVMTKSNVKVANYTGITVDSTIKNMLGNKEYLLLDLPGTYSVLPNSGDEGVVTQTLLFDSYNGIVNILDATHLKRNLHLSIQLMELGVPMVLVANMSDELERSGYKLDVATMESMLGVPVVPFTASTGKDEDAKHFVSHLEGLEPRTALELNYGLVIEKGIKRIKQLLRLEVMQVKKRWLAIQLLEGNEKIFEYIPFQKLDEIKEIIKETEQEVKASEEALSLKGAIFNKRRAFINTVLKTSLEQVSEKNHVKSTNQKLDKVLTSPFFGTFLFIATMYSIYHIAFGSGFMGLGVWLTGLFDMFYNGPFLDWIIQFFNAIGFKEGEFVSMILVDGALAGVGGVLIFLPQIIVLFVLLSTLEATGYMSRVAISLDGFFNKFGLNGKAIIPMIAGLGCSVPAVMATRTIADKRERLLTMISLPFISCSARLPIYGFFVSVFFDKNQALVIMFLYILGIVVALLSAKLFSLTYLKDAKSTFALELPPYRLPNMRSVFSQAIDRGKSFLKKAGTIIFIGSMIIWFMTAVGPNGMTSEADASYLAFFSGYIAPIFRPLGFGTWQATSALITGVLAKEVVVSTLTVIYGLGNIQASFTLAQALSFLVFSALYTPCISTLATIKAESGSSKSTLFAAFYAFLVAYIFAIITYGLASFIL